MSAVDGKPSRPHKRRSDEDRKRMSERATAQHDARRGFVIPPEKKDEARRLMVAWHNKDKRRRRKGERRHMPPELLRAALGLCFVLAMALPALGHTSDSGMQYPPSCCYGTAVTGDCAPIPRSSVKVGQTGHEVTLKPGDHQLVKDKTITFTVPFGDEKGIDGRRLSRLPQDELPVLALLLRRAGGHVGSPKSPADAI